MPPRVTITCKGESGCCGSYVASDGLEKFCAACPLIKMVHPHVFAGLLDSFNGLRPCAICNHPKSEHFDGRVNNCAEANGMPAAYCGMCKGTCFPAHTYSVTP